LAAVRARSDGVCGRRPFGRWFRQYSLSERDARTADREEDRDHTDTHGATENARLENKGK